MSLDVYLTLKGAQAVASDRIIPIRENGQNRMITRAEWDECFPDREPFLPVSASDDEVYSDNITHNLNKMAEEAGVYECLWRPDEISVETAAQLIKPLRKGLVLLRSNPTRFRKLNPSNGWGDYEGLVSFVRKYLSACKEYPDAVVSVWR